MAVEERRERTRRQEKNKRKGKEEVKKIKCNVVISIFVFLRKIYLTKNVFCV